MIDAENVSFAPMVLTDWTSGADPGDVDDALDQLADRLTWIVTGIKTTAYTASNRELVRVDPS